MLGGRGQHIGGKGVILKKKKKKKKKLPLNAYYPADNGRWVDSLSLRYGLLARVPP